MRKEVMRKVDTCFGMLVGGGRREELGEKGVMGLGEGEEQGSGVVIWEMEWEEKE